jgi:hypothetical protein
MKFCENPSRGSRAVPLGRAEVRAGTDMTKIIDTLRYFAKAPKNE